MVGTNLLSSGGQKYKLEKMIVHEGYNEKLQKLPQNDIGLLKTTKAIVMSNKVKAISLPQSNTEAGANLLVTGWGWRKVKCLFSI